jgi:catechol 2,3-dioxygenase-like lactoylglutathione lyase family enzyme
MKARLDHVGVVVASLDTAADFLREALGLELRLAPPASPDGMRIAFYGGTEKGDARVELIQVSSPEALAKRLGDAEARIEHIAIEVDDVRQVVEHLRARGVRFVTEEPYVLRDMLAIWTVAETSAGIQWQLFTRIK